MILHGYFRSSAAWRTRIAFNLKDVTPQSVIHNLRDGAQNGPAYAALNPQKLIPALELDDGTVLTQSLAIIGWCRRGADGGAMPGGAVHALDPFSHEVRGVEESPCWGEAARVISRTIWCDECLESSLISSTRASSPPQQLAAVRACAATDCSPHGFLSGAVEEGR